MSSNSFKLRVKGGDSLSKYDQNTGSYMHKAIDYVSEPESLGEALMQFLEYATDEYLEDKVTLTITPDKRKKK